MSLRYCKYCNEKMQYGLHNQIMIKTITESEKQYSRTIKYSQFGWKCNLKSHYCDIIFDDNNTGFNNINYKIALKNLEK